MRPFFAMAEPPVIAVTRNCFDCGQDFEDYSHYQRQRKCPACRKKPPPKPPPEQLRGKPLSPRESQIASAVAEGKLNKQIAYQCHLAEGTIKTYMVRIFRKTGQPNRAGLAAYWMRREKTL
jgi:DNA-binding NarL/FixJ family response regulator